MPPLPAVPSVLKAEILWKIGVDNSALNRFFVRYTGTAPSNADLDALANDVRGYIFTEWLPFVSAGKDLLGVTLLDLTSATSSFGESLITDPGTRTGGEVPAGSCVLVNAHIARRYRGGKPRMYVPFGVSSDLTDDNDWSGSLVDDTTTVLNGLKTAMLGYTSGGTTLGAMVNISYYEGFTTFLGPSGRYRNIPKLRVGGPVVDDIAAWAGKARVGSQRRRNLQRA